MKIHNTSNIFVTVVIPFFNAEKFLQSAIKSVFSQTFKNWELILIDDGSSDGSLAIARSVIDSRVRVISDGKNKRLSSRLNEVVSLAKYDLIARMDADDMMCPSRLAVQVNFLIENPGIDLVSSGLYSIRDDSTLVGHRGKNEDSFTVSEIISGKKGILHPGILARKSWYERNKYNEDMHISEDLDMWIRAIKKNDFKMQTTSDLLYLYRESQNVTVVKMLKAYQVEREVLCGHILPVSFRLLVLIKSYLKTLITFLLSKTVGVSFLQIRRNDSFVDKALQIKYVNILFQINKIELPGSSSNS